MKLKDETHIILVIPHPHPGRELSLGSHFMSANPRGYVGSHVLMIRENPRVLHGESSQDL